MPHATCASRGPTQAQLEGALQADEWLHGRMRSVQVTGRTKSVYSTWKKLQRHRCGVDGINDLVALRVVLNPEDHLAISSHLPHLPEEDGPLPPPCVTPSSSSLHQSAEGARRRDAEERALCYHVLGKVHGMWTPLPRTLKVDPSVRTPTPTPTWLRGSPPLEMVCPEPEPPDPTRKP